MIISIIYCLLLRQTKSLQAQPHLYLIIGIGYNMLLRNLSLIPSMLSRHGHSFATYYAAAKFFSQLETITGSIKKREAITAFRSSLSADDRNEFNQLIEFVNSKPKVGISSKIINKYYLKHFVPTTDVALFQPQMAHGGLMTMICNKDQESQLSLYDVNMFLKFLMGHTGTGSQTLKSKLVVELAASISELQGQYLLKLIDRNMPIGAKIKTFNKASLAEGIA